MEPAERVAEPWHTTRVPSPAPRVASHSVPPVVPGLRCTRCAGCAPPGATFRRPLRGLRPTTARIGARTLAYIGAVFSLNGEPREAILALSPREVRPPAPVNGAAPPGRRLPPKLRSEGVARVRVHLPRLPHQIYRQIHRQRHRDRLPRLRTTDARRRQRGRGRRRVERPRGGVGELDVSLAGRRRRPSGTRRRGAHRGPLVRVRARPCLRRGRPRRHDQAAHRKPDGAAGRDRQGAAPGRPRQGSPRTEGQGRGERPADRPRPRPGGDVGREDLRSAAQVVRVGHRHRRHQHLDGQRRRDRRRGAAGRHQRARLRGGRPAWPSSGRRSQPTAS